MLRSFFFIIIRLRVTSFLVNQLAIAILITILDLIDKIRIARRDPIEETTRRSG